MQGKCQFDPAGFCGEESIYHEKMYGYCGGLFRAVGISLIKFERAFRA